MPSNEARRALAGRGLRWVEAALAACSEGVAAILLIVEMGVLLANVIARYLFNHPLVFADELASILFLWLAMLGAVIALRRGEHMRLTLGLNALPEGWRPFVETLSALAGALFLLGLLPPAGDYIADQSSITTPALEISDGWRVAALGVGAVLMLGAAVLRLTERARPLHVAASVVLLGGLAGLFWLVQPVLADLGNLNLVIFFVGLVGVCVVIGVPIAFAFGLATISYLTFTTDTPLSIVVSRMDGGVSNLVLLAVPMFVFLGLLIEMTGMARAMVDFLAALIGHVRGGLAYVLLGAMVLVSGISGSKAADMAAVVPALFPEMKRRGAHSSELIALLASSGAMSETIPPSLVLITVGSTTGVSIQALFTGGMLPAAVAALALVAVVFFRSRQEERSGLHRASLRQVLRAFVLALPALVLPVLIRAAVVGGIATATEVSTLGIAYAALVGIFVHRRFDWRRLYPMLIETASLSGAILLIIGTATAMAWTLTQSGFSQALVDAMAAMPGGAAGFLVVSIAAFAVLGSLLEGIPAMVLFGPLLFPAARAAGINEVHYAMVVILAMGIGLFAPPFGLGFYTACAIGKVTPDAAMGRVWLYLAAVLAALAAVAAVPWLSVGFL